MARVDRLLTLGLGLNSSMFGKGLGDAVKQLNTFQTAAARTSKQLNSSLGSSFSGRLPQELARLRKEIKREGLQLVRELKAIDDRIDAVKVGKKAVQSDLKAYKDSLREKYKKEFDIYKKELEITDAKRRRLAESIYYDKQTLADKKAQAGADYLRRKTAWQNRRDELRNNINSLTKDAVYVGIRSRTDRATARGQALSEQGLTPQQYERVKSRFAALGTEIQAIKQLKHERIANINLESLPFDQKFKAADATLRSKAIGLREQIALLREEKQTTQNNLGDVVGKRRSFTARQLQLEEQIEEAKTGAGDKKLTDQVRAAHAHNYKLLQKQLVDVEQELGIYIQQNQEFDDQLRDVNNRLTTRQREFFETTTAREKNLLSRKDLMFDGREDLIGFDKSMADLEKDRLFNKSTINRVEGAYRESSVGLNLTNADEINDLKMRRLRVKDELDSHLLNRPIFDSSAITPLEDTIKEATDRLAGLNRGRAEMRPPTLEREDETKLRFFETQTELHNNMIARLESDKDRVQTLKIELKQDQLNLDAEAGSMSSFNNSVQEQFDAIGNVASAAFEAGLDVLGLGEKIANGIIRPSIRVFSNFATEVARYRSITDVAQGSELERQHMDLFRNTSLSSGYTQENVVRSFSNLVSAGLDNDTSAQFLPSLLKVTQGSYGEIDLPSAAKIMATTFQKFSSTLGDKGDLSQQAEYIADWVFQLKQASKLEFSEVAGFLDSVQAAPSLLNMSMEEVATLGTVLMRKGSSGRRSGQQINALTANLFKIVRAIDEDVPNGKAGLLIQEQNKLGYNLKAEDFYDEKGKFIGGFEFLKLINAGYQRAKETQGEGKATAGLYNLFSTTTGANVLGSIDEFSVDGLKGLPAVLKLMDAFSQAEITGLSDKASKSFLDSPEGMALRLNAITNTIQKGLGGKLFAKLTAHVSGFVDILAEVGKWIDKHGDVADFIADVTLALFGLTTALGTITVIGGGFVSFITGFIFLLSQLNPVTLTLTMLAGAIGISTTAFAGLGVSAVGTGNTLDWLKEKFNQVKLVFEGLAEMWGDYTAPEELFQKLHDGGVDGLVVQIIMLKIRFKELFAGIGEGMSEAKTSLANTLGEISDQLGTVGFSALAFSDPSSWRDLGKQIGTIFGAAYLAAKVFFVGLELIIAGFQMIRDQIKENEMALNLFGMTLVAVFIVPAFLMIGLLLTMIVFWGVLGIAVMGVLYAFYLFGEFLYWLREQSPFEGIMKGLSDLVTLFLHAMTIMFNGMGVLGEGIFNIFTGKDFFDPKSLSVQMFKGSIEAFKLHWNSDWGAKDGEVAAKNQSLINSSPTNQKFYQAFGYGTTAPVTTPVTTPSSAAPSGVVTKSTYTPTGQLIAAPALEDRFGPKVSPFGPPKPYVDAPKVESTGYTYDSAGNRVYHDKFAELVDWFKGESNLRLIGNAEPINTITINKIEVVAPAGSDADEFGKQFMTKLKKEVDRENRK